jgi:hypothetical protein
MAVVGSTPSAMATGRSRASPRISERGERGPSSVRSDRSSRNKRGERNMRRMLLRLGNSIAADRLFRRTPQGWVFRVSTPWILGPHPHYLVSEAQKARIEVVLGASHVAAWLFCAAIWLVLFPLAPSALLQALPDATGRLLALFLIISSLVVIGLQNLWHCFALRALLRNAPRTPEQITFAQRYEALVAMHSIEQLKFLLVLFLGLFLASVFLFAYQATLGHMWDFLWCVPITGGAAIYFGALVRAKLHLAGQI